MGVTYIVHVGVDLVHGHSSHHVKGIELYRGKLVLYGPGTSSTTMKVSAVRKRFAATSR
ncbi:CapA family protein [Paraburkholderia hospita]|jgi:poly-gamma-glutamate capsule biosynthesis protein CapA/YwtB (metallophosphatase superfamily)|uniref:CapA family protein n=1 Tax=Paraburkholderia hospita TaxID=169430 RepID=UPI0009A8ADCF|nr:CapA family protein [Paraburkholderia hospita]